jgi:hypothetical protein
METFEIDAEFEHGKPLRITGARVPMPQDYIDDQAPAILFDCRVIRGVRPLFRHVHNYE